MIKIELYNDKGKVLKIKPVNAKRGIYTFEFGARGDERFRKMYKKYKQMDNGGIVYGDRQIRIEGYVCTHLDGDWQYKERFKGHPFIIPQGGGRVSINVNKVMNRESLPIFRKKKTCNLPKNKSL